MPSTLLPAAWLQRPWVPWALAGLVLLLFVIAKLPHLSLPYYWDESWVYAPALRLMHDAGPSLSPTAIDLDYSRGHPLLFHFLGGLWLKVFGTSKVAMHSYGLACALALLLSVFWVGKQLFSPLLGLAGMAGLAVQPVFFSHASMVTPEVMLGLWAVLTFYGFLARRWWLYFLAGSALLLTKESGLMMIAALGLGWLLELVFVRKTHPFQPDHLRFGLRLLLPLLPVLLFFIAQRIMLGWFFYPEHTGMIDLSWAKFHEKTVAGYSFLLEEEARYVLLLLMMVAVAATRQLSPWVERLGIPLGILVGSSFFQEVRVPKEAEVKLGLSVLVLVLSLVLLLKRYFAIAPEHKRPLAYAGLFGVVFLLFSAVNFYTGRYLICVLALSIPLMLVVAYRWLEGRRWLWALLTLFFLINTAFQNQHRSPGNNRSIIDAMKVQEELVRFFEEEKLYEASIHANFLAREALRVPYAGYRSDGLPAFTGVTWEYSDRNDYVVVGAIEPNPDLREQLQQRPDATRIKEFRHGAMWYEVYQIQKN